MTDVGRWFVAQYQRAQSDDNIALFNHLYREQETYTDYYPAQAIGLWRIH